MYNSNIPFITGLIVVGLIFYFLAQGAHADGTSYCGNNGTAITCFTYHDSDSGQVNGNKDTPDITILYNTPSDDNSVQDTIDDINSR